MAGDDRPMSVQIRPPPLTVAEAELDALPWAHVTGRFRALDHDFAVRTTDSLTGRYLEAALAPLAAPGRAESQYSVIDDPTMEPHFAVYVGSERKLMTSDTDALAPLVLWHVNHEAVRKTTRHLLVHASVAEYEGTALLFPAPMESGKSTLVAGLVQAGLQYLTDETAAIDVGSLVIHPYPKSISLDPGSWPLLPSLHPQYGPELEAFSSLQWSVDPRAIRSDAIGSPCRPGLVIAPRFAEGATTRLEPMPRAEAVVVLAEQAFNLDLHGQAGLEALGAIARRSDCYRLVMGDLDSAVGLLWDILPPPTR